MNDFLTGLRAYGDAFRFIGKHHLSRFFLIPGILSLLFVAVILGAGLHWFPDFAQTLISYYPDWLNAGILRFLTHTIIWALGLFVGIITSKYVALILLSPVMSHLSEITEEILSGRKKQSPGMRGMLSDISRSLRLNIRNFIYEIITCFFPS